MKYIKRIDIGKEYFEGNYKNMITDIFNIVTKYEKEAIVNANESTNILRNELTEEPLLRNINKNNSEKKITYLIVNNIVNSIIDSIIDTIDDSNIETIVSQDTNLINVVEDDSANKGKFYCKICKFNAVYIRDYNRHLVTTKHVNRINLCENKRSHNIKQPFFCLICNKEYQTTSGLWKHNQKCTFI